MMPRVHFLTLDVGETFRLVERGPLLKRAPDHEGIARARPVDPPGKAFRALLLETMFVLPTLAQRPSRRPEP